MQICPAAAACWIPAHALRNSNHAACSCTLWQVAACACNSVDAWHTPCHAVASPGPLRPLLQAQGMMPTTMFHATHSSARGIHSSLQRPGARTVLRLIVALVQVTLGAIVVASPPPAPPPAAAAAETETRASHARPVSRWHPLTRARLHRSRHFDSARASAAVPVLAALLPDGLLSDTGSGMHFWNCRRSSDTAPVWSVVSQQAAASMLVPRAAARSRAHMPRQA